MLQYCTKVVYTCQAMPKRKSRPGLCYLYDTREKWPYKLAVPDPQWFDDFGSLEVTLAEGDTSVELDTKPLDVIIERKQLNDFLGCCGRNRERFDNELARLAAHEQANVIIEAPVAQIRSQSPRSMITPVVAWNSIIHWRTAYPTVHWWTVTNHTEGAITARVLIHEFAKHKLGEV